MKAYAAAISFEYAAVLSITPPRVEAHATTQPSVHDTLREIEASNCRAVNANDTTLANDMAQATNKMRIDLRIGNLNFIIPKWKESTRFPQLLQRGGIWQSLDVVLHPFPVGLALWRGGKPNGAFNHQVLVPLAAIAETVLLSSDYGA